ncbi:MAG: transposase, partial [Candidatus Eremiobacteraeota bacterium]|nr:transposase [Candidatus Eremiobacteraeota bacterium]
RPGRPSDNAFCESFNNRVRQELVNPQAACSKVLSVTC